MTFQEYITENAIKVTKNKGFVEVNNINRFGRIENIKLKYVSKQEFEYLSVLYDYLTKNKDVKLSAVYSELASNKKLKDYFTLVKQSSIEQTLESIDELSFHGPMYLAIRINSRRKLEDAVNKDEKLKKNRVFLEKQKD